MFMLPSTPDVGVVAALASEAAGLIAAGHRREGHLWPAGHGVAGMGHLRATAASQCLVERGARALVSWGIAGGVSPAFRAGRDILLPTSIVGKSREWVVDSAWRKRIARALAACGSVATGRLWCGEMPVLSIAAKAGLAAQGFAASDMESAAVAQWPLLPACHSSP